VADCVFRCCGGCDVVPDREAVVHLVPSLGRADQMTTGPLRGVCVLLPVVGVQRVSQAISPTRGYRHYAAASSVVDPSFGSSDSCTTVLL
jgi:hypothetical protein